ncbi:MAG: hypothetical protein A2014_12720 [Spirochaetes bacterium GWF1_49_6]|nr:MAG: hypothetical protein A2014_12720 [Spirochaetes bacterium GWF1_49_6]
MKDSEKKKVESEKYRVKRTGFRDIRIHALMRDTFRNYYHRAAFGVNIPRAKSIGRAGESLLGCDPAKVSA